jgi:hypothetical protein
VTEIREKALVTPTAPASPAATRRKNMPTEQLSPRERNDLLMLVRQRASVAKNLASQRAAELLADFDEQIATYYNFLDDDVWRAAMTKAKAVAKASNDKIQQRCRELKIPKRFAPRLEMPYWVKNGFSYELERERKEFKEAAKAKIDAMKKAAVTEISRRSVEAQEKILIPGLTSPLAEKLLAEIPKIADLMPMLDIHVVAKLIGKDQPDEPG